jgi:hypothetical protein
MFPADHARFCPECRADYYRRTHPPQPTPEIRAEAKRLLLTLDGDHCRDDVWHALQWYAEWEAANDRECHQLPKLIKRFCPPERQNDVAFCAALESELLDWLGCARDEYAEVGENDDEI